MRVGEMECGNPDSSYGRRKWGKGGEYTVRLPHQKGRTA